jgi:hypothetical protein
MPVDFEAMQGKLSQAFDLATDIALGEAPFEARMEAMGLMAKLGGTMAQVDKRIKARDKAAQRQGYKVLPDGEYVPSPKA